MVSMTTFRARLTIIHGGPNGTSEIVTLQNRDLALESVPVEITLNDGEYFVGVTSNGESHYWTDLTKAVEWGNKWPRAGSVYILRPVGIQFGIPSYERVELRSRAVAIPVESTLPA